MKNSNKFFLALALVALFTSIFAGSALAADSRIVRFADIYKVKLLGTQPASLQLLGTITCDYVQVNSSVSGKTINIYVYDVKIKYTGVGCGQVKSFKRTINVGTLVPGKYTVLINPDGHGKPQKKVLFIAPMLPANTPTAAIP